jgi:hypothetical protein
MNWLCWHVGTVTDPKFGRIADACKTARVNVIGVWAVILEKAKEGRGLYSLDADDAGYALGIAPGLVEQIHAELQAKGLVDCGEVVNWEKRQHGGSAKRMAAKRARDAATPPAAQSDDVTESDVTLRHVTPTDRQTDTQTDILNKLDREEIKKIAPSRKREAAVTLPPEWAPSESETKFALEMGLSPDEAAREAIKFRAYWVNGKGGGTRRKTAGWASTWQNWISRTAENLPRGKHEPSHNAERPTSWAAIVAEETQRSTRDGGG